MKIEFKHFLDFIIKLNLKNYEKMLFSKLKFNFKYLILSIITYFRLVMKLYWQRMITFMGAIDCTKHLIFLYLEILW